MRIYCSHHESQMLNMNELDAEEFVKLHLHLYNKLKNQQLNKNNIMNNILKFQKALDRVSEVTPLLIGEAQNDFNSKSQEFIDELQKSHYIKVPLVGGFSAGKSSLLNVFTQKPGMLPVALCLKEA